MLEMQIQNAMNRNSTTASNSVKLDREVTPTLRETELEMETLRKANFDLKMKIFYLEEKLNKLDKNDRKSIGTEVNWPC